MYQTLTFYHSFMRWLVLASLLFALYRAYKGYFSTSAFSNRDNAVRNWTATIAHIQLMIGMILYFQSPLVKYFLANFKTAAQDFNMLFFGLIHSSLMLIAIVLITIGSAVAKRKETDKAKFKTMMIWFTVALVIICIAIPWPFSPFTSRPYFR
ncbi:hypothetical protein [Sphingobacterium pedocola]|uniref:Cytochrome B n=1 Tax=Sphingobacterium pedocola TaxID=2082722 RepID=A0ABR9T995_9SPHI|nr:hypothetical protein [Sphingobacterium pedocola]MBE8721898.1 hypothetical protein [Sphingobacterium pedocola]